MRPLLRTTCEIRTSRYFRHDFQ